MRTPLSLLAALSIGITAAGSTAAVAVSSGSTVPEPATPTTTPQGSVPVSTGPGSAGPESSAAPFDQAATTIDELLGLGRPIVLAHTAGEDEFPASTMFAFGESMRAGVDMLDFNVQLTADGVLVVHHDDDVDRATNGTGLVAEQTAAELAELDDAYWFTAECVCQGQPDDAYLYRGIRTGERPAPAGYTADDFAIPTLSEVLARYPDIPMNIEIKGEGANGLAAAQRLAAELYQSGRAPDTVVVSSFDDAVLHRFVELASDIEVSPALSAATAFVISGTPLPEGQRILQLPPVYGDFEVLTPEVVERAHDAGYVIWVWPNDRGLENETSYLDFLDAGMDGLNINFPATGVAAVESWLDQ